MKKKPKKLLSLSERIEAVKEEADRELDKLSKKYRPETVPAPWVRRNWLAKANGNVVEAYLVAVKETTNARQTV